MPSNSIVEDCQSYSTSGEDMHFHPQSWRKENISKQEDGEKKQKNTHTKKLVSVIVLTAQYINL